MLLKVSIPGYSASDEESTMFFLIVMVLIFTFCSLCFFFLLLISKLREKGRKRKIAMFTPTIDKVLLGMLFEGKTIPEISNEINFKRLMHKRFFRELLIDNIIKLHTSFAGDYREKLELFYRTAGLDKMSFRKLNSIRWHIRCEGVNELSRMQVIETYPRLLKLSHSRNNTVKLEVMVGMIRLQGTEGLMAIADHGEPINDWIQLNIISVVKNASHPEMPDFGPFLESENESVVLLGMRLVSTFGQLHHLQRIHEIVSASQSRSILTEGKRILGELPFQTIQTENT